MPVEVSALVKCDFNRETQKYELLVRYILPPKKSSEIVMPSRYRHCEIYPAVHW